MMRLMLVIPIVLILQSCGFEVVETGYRGVKTRFGKVVSETLGEGLYFHVPMIESIKELDVRVQKFINKTTTYTKDAQIVEVTSTANIKLDDTKVHIVFPTVGKNWEQKLVRQVLEGSVKEVIGKYTAVELIANREKATDEMRNILRKRLSAQNISITGFDLNNFDFDDRFEEAVKNKVIAIEQAKESQNRTVRIEEEAKQQIIAAQAEAESMRIRANALTQNKSLVEYEAVQKWDGKLPQYMLGGSMPFIQLDTKK